MQHLTDEIVGYANVWLLRGIRVKDVLGIPVTDYELHFHDGYVNIGYNFPAGPQYESTDLTFGWPGFGYEQEEEQIRESILFF